MRKALCAAEAGEDGGDFFLPCEAAGAGFGEATDYASKFGVVRHSRAARAVSMSAA